MFPVDGKQIDCVDAIFMSLQEIKLVIGVIVQMMLEKGATTNGFFLRVHLVRFSGSLKIPTWIVLVVPIFIWHVDVS